MRKQHRRNRLQDQGESAAPLPSEEGHPANPASRLSEPSTDTPDGSAEPEEAAGAALLEPLAEAVKRLEGELGLWKDRALRATADLENFRKRTLRDREDAQHRGAGDVLSRIVDVIDDLARVAHLDPATTDVTSLHEGMLAIERKFLNALALSGLERIEPAGEVFDPQLSEAVATLPAPSADQDHHVGAVYQNGYRYRGVLLRPARVAVFQWSGERAE